FQWMRRWSIQSPLLSTVYTRRKEIIMRISKTTLVFLLFIFTLFGSTAVLGADGTSTKNDYVAKAETFVQQLSKGDFASAETNLTDQMKQAAPPEKLKEVWDGITAKAGAYQKTVKTRTVNAQGDTIILMKTQFKNGPVWITVTFDKTDKIAGMHLVPVK
ncbi:MAG: DUF3887 domain-containing protein, partial [Candidatus Dormibacteria bacterium]